MSDEETNADTGAALPGDGDDDSWVRWQPMNQYKDGTVALTMASPASQLFGVRHDGVWHEMIDGEEHAMPGYEPKQWTRVPEEKWADFAFG